MENSSRISKFKTSVFPKILAMVDKTNPAIKEHQAVCLVAEGTVSFLEPYLKGGAEGENDPCLVQMTSDFMTLLYHYSAIGMLTPELLTYSRFLKLSGLLGCFKLAKAMLTYKKK